MKLKALSDSELYELFKKNKKKLSRRVKAIVLGLYLNQDKIIKLKDMYEFREVKTYEKIIEEKNKQKQQDNNPEFEAAQRKEIHLHTVPCERIKLGEKNPSKNYYFETDDNENWYITPDGIKFVETELKDILSYVLAEPNIITEFDEYEEYQAEFQRKVQKSAKLSSSERLKRLENLNKKPEEIYLQVKHYKRNPDVVAEVLYRANGCCESCSNKAPFIRRSDGTPYLEVHHKIPLSNGGDDTIENAVALYPNCHRKEHFGIDKI